MNRDRLRADLEAALPADLVEVVIRITERNRSGQCLRRNRCSETAPPATPTVPLLDKAEHDKVRSIDSGYGPQVVGFTYHTPDGELRFQRGNRVQARDL